MKSEHKYAPAAPESSADAALDCVRDAERYRAIRRQSMIRKSKSRYAISFPDVVAAPTNDGMQYEQNFDLAVDALLAQADAGATQHSTKEASDGR